jgi:hypothetical protein
MIPRITPVKRKRLSGAQLKKENDRYERNAAERYEVVKKWSVVASAVVPPRQHVPITKTVEQRASAKAKRDKQNNELRDYEDIYGKITKANFAQMTDFVGGTGPLPQQQLQSHRTASTEWVGSGPCGSEPYPTAMFTSQHHIEQDGYLWRRWTMDHGTIGGHLCWDY